MKNVLSVILMLLTSLFANAQQNYVPNGDFEDYVGCPSDYSQINLARGWRKYSGGTPDYFNSCATNWRLSTPANYFGYQQPASGQGYVGVYASNGLGEYKEYVTRDIIPLTPGGEYEVSLSLSLCDTSDTAESDIGVFFYKSGPAFIYADTTPPVKPQVIFTSYGYLEDQVNWMRLTKTFVADSAYDNIVIGSFKDSNSRTIFEPLPSVPFPPGVTGVDVPYYYIDSIVVRLLDTVKVEYTDGILCAGDAIQVKYWTRLLSPANNVVTIQLSDANGSFANPVEIGSKQSNKSGLMVCNIPPNTPNGNGYRIRAVCTAPAETSVDNGVDISIVHIDNLVALNNGPVCANDTLRLTATQDTTGATYKWTGPNNFGSFLQNPVLTGPVKANAGDYVVTAKIYRCTTSDTTTVEVLEGNRAHNVQATSNSPVCAGDSLLLSGDAEGSSPFEYSWEGPVGFSASEKGVASLTKTKDESGKYIFSVRDKECVVRDTVEVVVNPAAVKPVLAANTPLGIHGTLHLELTNPTIGASVMWTGPEGFSNNTYNPSIPDVSLSQTGTYKLITEYLGCSDSSEIEVRIYDVKDTGTFVLYPNPNSGTFTIKGLVYNDNPIPVVIFSTLGGEIHKQDLIPINKIVSDKIELQGRLWSGVYFAKLFIGRETVIVPFTVVW
ncbi:MAG: T9SS type A sorting domain-containing protein [Chitinophagaceae bacterium]|nr:T9SS type A sorting domain-containing protein [Chitinophagaceae bacterium]